MSMRAGHEELFDARSPLMRSHRLRTLDWVATGRELPQLHECVLRSFANVRTLSLSNVVVDVSAFANFVRVSCG